MSEEKAEIKQQKITACTELYFTAPALPSAFLRLGFLPDSRLTHNVLVSIDVRNVRRFLKAKFYCQYC